MTVKEMLMEAGIKEDNIALLSFTSSPEAPFAAILKSDIKAISADGVVAAIVEMTAVELYCEPDDEETHRKFEKILDRQKVNYEAGIVRFSGDWDMYEYIYKFINKEDY